MSSQHRELIDAADRPYPEVPTRADFPAIERRLLERWDVQRTFERSVEQRPVDDEFVFYDGPPFANGLPHYGHLLTGYVKDVVPRYQTMRGHRVERRFGWDCHGLPAEMAHRAGARRLGPGRHHRLRHRAFNDALPLVGDALHRRVGALRHPPGPLGRLRRRLQDDGPRLHGVGDLGVQPALGQGPDLRGVPGHAVLVGSGDAAVELRDPPRRRHPAPPGPRTHRGLRASSRRREAAELPDAPQGADGASRCGRGRPRPGPCRPTSPSPSAPTSSTLVVARCAPAREPGVASCWARTRLEAYAAELGEDHEVVATLPGQRAGRDPLPPAVRVLRRSSRHLPGPRRRLGDRRRRHRHRAPGSRLRRGRPARLRGSGHRAGGAGRRRRPLHRRGRRLGRRRTSSTPTPRSSRTSRQRNVVSATTPTTTTTRTAGGPTPRSSTRPSAPGTSRSPPSATASWS